MKEYLGIFIIILFGLLVGVLIFFASYLLILRDADEEKLTIIECGFDTFEESRGKFDVSFYLVAILFIIFDLEIMFLFPFVMSLPRLDLLGFYSVMYFLIILGVGFVYEWRKGALDW